jgi:hypothetical protein
MGFLSDVLTNMVRGVAPNQLGSMRFTAWSAGASTEKFDRI